MRTRAALLSLLLLAAVLAGCSKDVGIGLGTTDDPEATSAAPAPPPVSPLTGLPLVDGEPDHPVYVVKVDNTPAAFPQVGVIHADVVVEELVEGGLTRLAALYYAKTPDEIGPVRSMRATDIGLARPLDATIIASGGAPVTISRIREAGIPILSEDTGQDGILLKSPDRRAPYDRILDLRTVAGEAERPERVPPLLPFGPAATFAGTRPGTTFTVRFGPGAGTRWALDGKVYRRQNGLAEQGKEFKADNVLVLRAPVTDAGYTDPAGNPVPETVLEGKGRATLFHGGKRVEARWYKSSAASELGLTTRDGARLTVPTGRTWIELVPETTGDVAVTD